MPRNRDKLLDSICITVFNIVLPTLDVYSDLVLIITHLHYKLPLLPDLPSSHEINFGILLLPPFLINYLLTWLAWWRLEKKHQCSWFFPLFSCYPQYRAAALLRLTWSDEESAANERKTLEREVAEFEAMVESVPTVFIMSFALAVTGGKGVITEEGGQNLFSPEVLLFLFTFLTSIASATLGMIKPLKSGPCKILPSGGLFGGYLTLSCILLFFTMGATMVGKGLALAWLSAFHPSVDLFDRMLWLLAFTFLPQANNFSVSPTLAT